MKNKFDRVMDYIDDCIFSLYDDDDIRKGIRDLIGYDSNSFNKCMQVVTGESLTDYIRRRKFYFASEQLKDPNNSKRILDIAIECGYSENAVFTRQMKFYYGCTPSDIRNGIAEVPNEKYHLIDFCNETTNTRVRNIVKAFEQGQPIFSVNESFLTELYEDSERYQWDVDVSFALADVAEKFGVSVFGLMGCVHSYIETQTFQGAVLPPEAEYAIECGIETEEDMRAICRRYGCSVYDLNPGMVDEFYGLL